MKTATKLALGALGVAAVGAIVSRGRPAVAKARVPTRLWPDEGELEGYSYTTYHAAGAIPGDASAVLIQFHGRGGSPAAYADLLVPHLQVPAHIIVPRGKNAGPKWFMSRAADADQDTLAAQMRWTIDDFEPFVREVKRVFGRKPIVVGHSQGGMMASALALHKPQHVAKAVGASAWVPEALWTAGGAPVVLVHGIDDTTVPYQRTSQWVAAEQKRGAPIELRSLLGSHGLSGQLHASWIDAIHEAIA